MPGTSIRAQLEAKQPESRTGAAERREEKKQAWRGGRSCMKAARLEFRINRFSAPEGLTQIAGGPSQSPLPLHLPALGQGGCPTATVADTSTRAPAKPRVPKSHQKNLSGLPHKENQLLRGCDPRAPRLQTLRWTGTN